MLTDYMVVTEISHYVFMAAVNSAISRGYRPQGGVCLDSRGHYYQAMVK